MAIFNETPEAIELMKPRVQRPSSKEELGALIEGDVLFNDKLGNMVYTERYGEPRLIRQLNESEILSVYIEEGIKSQYSVWKDGSIEIKRGDRISVMGDWIQYDLDQSILEKAGFYGQKAQTEAQAEKY